MADYIVTGPDGAKYKITADNDEAANHAVQQLFGSAAAPPAQGGGGSAANEPDTAPVMPPKAPTLVDHVMNTAKNVAGVVDQGVRGAAQGMAGTVGLPATLGKMLGQPSTGPVTLLGGIPFLSPEAMNEGLNWLNRHTAATLGLNPPQEQPEGPAQRVANRVGQEIGAAMVPVGGAVATGSRMAIPEARVATEAASKLPWVARIFAKPGAEMVESAAVNPGRLIGREAKMATGAGLGAAGVNELTGKAQADAAGKPSTGYQTLGDLIGQFGGAGLTALASKAGEVGGHLLDAIRGHSPEGDRVIRDVATDEIARAAGLKPSKPGAPLDTEGLAAEVANGKSVGDVIPGFVESTADRSKNPGLAALEYSRQSGPNSGLYAAKRSANTAAVDAAMGRSEPQATPGAFSSELDLERNRRLTDAMVGRENATSDAAAATAPLTPSGTAATRGNTIRGELDTAREAARTATADAYGAADINNAPLQPRTLSEALNRVTDGLPRADRVDTPQGLIDQIANLPADQPTTMREATALKTRLLDMQREAAARPGGRNAARVLGQYLDAVEGVIQGGMTPEQQAALATARGARATEAQAFDRQGDPVSSILAEYPGGRPKMRDENVARLATRNDALGRILQQADTPATRAAIRDELLSNADTSTPQGLRQFLDRYGPQVDRFPGLRDELVKAQGARTAEVAATQTESALQREIGQQGRGTVARYLQYGDENAQKAMQGVISSKDPARSIDELLTFVNDDPKAVEGARKVFWDIMQRKVRSGGSTTATIGGSQPYLPAALKKFTEDPATAAVAERLYRDNPEHWQNVKKIAEAMQGVDVRNAAKAPNTSGTGQTFKNDFMPSPEALQSRIFAVERGVVSPAYAALNVISIMARKAMRNQNVEAVHTAIDKALLDPEFAALLLKQNNPANRAALRYATRGWKTDAASQFMQMLSPDSQDEATKRAVMRGAK